MSTEKMSRYMIALWACEGIARQLAQRATRLTGKEMRKFLAGDVARMMAISLRIASASWSASIQAP